MGVGEHDVPHRHELRATDVNSLIFTVVAGFIDTSVEVFRERREPAYEE